MKSWLKSLRRALLLAATWGMVWAPLAVLVGTTIIDPDNSMDEMWVMVGALPGFMCAVIFSALLSLAARPRSLAEVSLIRAGTTGALAGLMAGVFPFTIGSSSSQLSPWVLGGAVIGSITLLSTLSAIASVMVARTARRRLPRTVAL